MKAKLHLIARAVLGIVRDTLAALAFAGSVILTLALIGMALKHFLPDPTWPVVAVVCFGLVTLLAALLMILLVRHRMDRIVQQDRAEEIRREHEEAKQTPCKGPDSRSYLPQHLRAEPLKFRDNR